MGEGQGQVISDNTINPGSIYVTYYSFNHEMYFHWDMVMVKKVKDDGTILYNKFLREDSNIMKSQSYNFFINPIDFHLKYKKLELTDYPDSNIKINETYSLIKKVKGEFYLIKILGCDIKNQVVYFRGFLGRDIETKIETIDHKTTSMDIDLFKTKYELFMF